MSAPEALRLANAITAWSPSDPARHIDACRSAAAELRRQHAEIERLTACLKTANANHEHFEREWYLRGDEIERLTAARLLTIANLLTKPTEDMELAGMRALRNTYRTVTGAYSREQARACWGAMVAAMTQGKGPSNV